MCLLRMPPSGPASLLVLGTSAFAQSGNQVSASLTLLFGLSMKGVTRGHSDHLGLQIFCETI